MEKVFCKGCRNYWPKAADSQRCEIVRGRIATWLSRSEECVESADPAEKNANNDCKDFKETTLGHLIFARLQEG